jgi:type VI secretion system secreted protein Hcp
MAETVHLYLKANGKDIKGESTQTSLGRQDSIECVVYDQGVQTAREASTGMVTGRRQYGPLRIVKRLDKASPLILKALTENQVIDAMFKFFRPNPAGDGTTEQFYTVKLKKGHVASVKQYVESTLGEQTRHIAPLEEVTLVFQDIAWTYTNGGIEHSDSWAGQK